MEKNNIVSYEPLSNESNKKLDGTFVYRTFLGKIGQTEKIETWHVSIDLLTSKMKILLV